MSNYAQVVTPGVPQTAPVTELHIAGGAVQLMHSPAAHGHVRVACVTTRMQLVSPFL